MTQTAKSAPKAPKPEMPKEDNKPAEFSKKVHPFHAKAKEVFATHQVDEVHFTGDGTAFIHKQHARAHAENLKDSVIQTIKREEV